MIGALCVLVSLVLLNIPDRTQVRVSHALSAVIVNPWLGIRNFGVDVLHVRAENARIGARSRTLEFQLAALRREQHDADRGAGPAILPGFVGSVAPCQVVARQRARMATMIQILSLDPLDWAPELPVITAEGLIGRLHTVIDSRAAWVELLTAPDMAIGVEFERTGLLGVLRPRGQRFVVEFVGRDEDVLPGDAVMTSSVAEIRDEPGGPVHDPVPRGLLVGRVGSVSAPSDQIFKEIELEPSASFRRNETVYVVGATAVVQTDPGAAP